MVAGLTCPCKHPQEATPPRSRVYWAEEEGRGGGGAVAALRVLEV